MRAALVIALWMVASAGLVRQPSAQGVYVLTPESQLQIEGTSTIDGFTCEAMEVIGSGRLRKPSYDQTSISAATGEVQLNLTVPVAALDCGKERMNRDLHAALKAVTYPDIEFRLERVEIPDDAASNNDVQPLHAVGRLRLAGVERQVRVDVAGSAMPDGRLRARGAVDMLMTDFGVSPPKALLGLVRAHDKITVRFDLYGTRAQIAHVPAR